MKNKLSEMQDILLKNMRLLDSHDANDEKLALMISKCNALAVTSTSILKTINVGLRVMELSTKYNKSTDALNKELGITNEE